MKPIDFFDQLDQAREAGAGSLKGDAHAALWLAQRLRRISCSGKAPAGLHASFRVGQQASAASSPAALQCIFLAMNILAEKSEMCYELPFSRSLTRMICR
jgi:hypothetical protein